MGDVGGEPLLGEQALVHGVGHVVEGAAMSSISSCGPERVAEPPGARVRALRSPAEMRRAVAATRRRRRLGSSAARAAVGTMTARAASEA